VCLLREDKLDPGVVVGLPKRLFCVYTGTLTYLYDLWLLEQACLAAIAGLVPLVPECVCILLRHTADRCLGFDLCVLVGGRSRGRKASH
jgi:hypothetical protein